MIGDKPIMKTKLQPLIDDVGDIQKSPNVPHSKVLVINTGGTIVMVNNADGKLIPERNALKTFIRGHRDLNDDEFAGRFCSSYSNLPFVLPVCQGKRRVLYWVYEYNPLLDSSNMGTDDWKKIAKDIWDGYKTFDGFVILHGTDTMVYTASALSFMFANLGKPIVITGAQKSIFEKVSDGPANFKGSVIVAANDSIPEVTLFFNKKLFRGNRTIKVSSISLSAFDSPNQRPIAELKSSIKGDACLVFRSTNRENCNLNSTSRENNNLNSTNRENNNLNSTNRENCNLNSTNRENCNLISTNRENCNLNSTNQENNNLNSTNQENCNLNSTNQEKNNLNSTNQENNDLNSIKRENCNLNNKLNSNVLLLTITPFIKKSYVEMLLQYPVEGVVIETYGAGNMQSNRPEIIEAFREAANRGVILINITQCPHGTVSSIYETGEALGKAGVISGCDMTPAAALTKLSYILAMEELDLEAKKKMMRENLRGEMTLEGEIMLDDDNDAITSCMPFLRNIFKYICSSSV